jgi:hypothetical protein
LVGEQESKKFADPVATIGDDGDKIFPVFSCIEVEPMTIWSKKKYAKNKPKDVGWEFYEEGDHNGKKYKKKINVIFNKWKDPSTASEFHPWISIEGQVWLEGKKSIYFDISNTDNTFKCGAKYSINIDFNNMSDIAYKESTIIVDDKLNAGTSFVDISSTNVFEFPSFGSFSLLESFANKVDQIEYKFDNM